MRPKTYSENQLQILQEYYLDGRWDKILPFFPNKTKADIRAIARKNSIKRVKSLIKDMDITGERFNKLVAKSKVTATDKFVKWKCLCDCGNETIVDIYSLTSGRIKSCGCLKHAPAYNAKDLTGLNFGLLEVVERIPRYKGVEVYYRCICECGREKIVSSGNLSTGNTRSCGIRNHKKAEYQALNLTHDDTLPLYSVYRHISPNGKSYIGITMQSPERRFQNGNGYKTQTAFNRAIQKYGWDNFKHEILEENLTEREACEKEAYYISEVYNSFAPNGYNSREGGTTGRNNVTPIIQFYKGEPVNFFESISIASKDLNIAQKTIRMHCGESNSIEGYHFIQMDSIAPYKIPEKYRDLLSPEHKKAIKRIISLDSHNRVVSRNKASVKPINKYTLEGQYICTFPSLVEAKKSIADSDGGAIAAAVNPNRQGDNAYGYMWKYDTGNHDNIAPIKYKAQRSVLKISKSDGTILDSFKSMSVASKELHVNMYHIKKACDGDDTIFDGFRLRYK